MTDYRPMIIAIVGDADGRVYSPTENVILARRGRAYGHEDILVHIPEKFRHVSFMYGLQIEVSPFGKDFLFERIIPYEPVVDASDLPDMPDFYVWRGDDDEEAGDR